MRRWLLPVMLLAGIGLSACSQETVPVSPTPSPSASAQQVIEVAQGPSLESRILANLYVGALNAARQPAGIVDVGSDDALLPSLEQGQADVAGTTVTAATTELNRQAASPSPTPTTGSDPGEATNTLRELARPQQLLVLNPADARVGRAFAVRVAFAEENDLESLSDLGRLSQESPVTLGGPSDCPTDPTCLPGLESTYGLEVSRFVDLGSDPTEALEALKAGTVDVAVVESSDGQVEAFNLAILTDDQNLQPVENLVPLVREGVATPEMADILNAVSARLTSRALRDMSFSIAQGGEDPAKVTDAWLAVNGLA